MPCPTALSVGLIGAIVCYLHCFLLQMEQYCYKRKADGQYIIHLKTLWEKLLLAARAIAAIENPGGLVYLTFNSVPSG